MEAVRDLTSEKGVRNFTFDDICNITGINKEKLDTYFIDEADLVRKSGTDCKSLYQKNRRQPEF